MTKRKIKKRKRVLNDTHRAFIIQQLACFLSPSETAEAVNKEFGLDVSRQAMERYDPHKHAGRRIAQRWKDLFVTARQAFLDHVENRVPHANKSVRIKKLAHAADAFERNKNYLAMSVMLEKIAREMGSAYTNRREVTGRDRGSIKFEDINSMTDDQIDAELRQILGIKDADVHKAPDSEQ